MVGIEIIGSPEAIDVAQPRHIAGKMLLRAMVEFQDRHVTKRMSDGLLEPWLSRCLFEIAFTAPCKGGFITPMETFGTLQQCVHSRDGKYVSISLSGLHPRVWVSAPSDHDSATVKLIKTLRDIATKHDVWVASLTADGALAELSVGMIAPGVLIPNPGVLKFVSLRSFSRHIAKIISDRKNAKDNDEFDDSIDSLPRSVLAVAASGHTVDVSDHEDEDVCLGCGGKMAMEKPQGGEIEMWHCVGCGFWRPTRELLERQASSFEERKGREDARASYLELIRERHP
jgi:hypothetical protein